MRDLIINMLVKQAGLPRIPKDQKDFFNMIAGNTQFNSDLRKLESMGVLKRNDDGTLNVIDQNKVNNIVQNFIMGLIGGKNGR